MVASVPEISVIVPCYNERDNIQPLVAAIRAAMEPVGRTWELVVVDDASTDSTWTELQKVATTEPRLRAVRFAQNSGQSAALWAGLQQARGAILITLDADLQNPPAEIPRFLAAIKQADCVCGSRVEQRRAGDNWLRVISSRIANHVRNKLSGETISDAGCCFRALRRECLANVKFFCGAHRFLPTLIRMEGFTVIEIPIAHHPRHAGQTHYGVWNRLFASFTDLLAVRWMKKRQLRYQIVEELPR